MGLQRFGTMSRRLRSPACRITQAHRPGRFDYPVGVCRVERSFFPEQGRCLMHRANPLRTVRKTH